MQSPQHIVLVKPSSYIEECKYVHINYPAQNSNENGPRISISP